MGSDVGLWLSALLGSLGGPYHRVSTPNRQAFFRVRTTARLADRSLRVAASLLSAWLKSSSSSSRARGVNSAAAAGTAALGLYSRPRKTPGMLAVRR